MIVYVLCNKDKDYLDKVEYIFKLIDIRINDQKTNSHQEIMDIIYKDEQFEIISDFAWI